MAKWTFPTKELPMISEIDKEIQETLDDGRPCSTDLFLIEALEYEEDAFSLQSRIENWVEGEWEMAIAGLRIVK